MPAARPSAVLHAPNYDAASRVVESSLADGGVLTVDVFDTLLLRACTPELALRTIHATMAERLGAAPVAVAAARARAERRLGNTHLASGGDGEHRHGDLLSAMLADLAACRTALPELAGIELDVETGLLCANQRLAASLRKVRASGVRVVAISDMYLSAEAVAELLRRHGLSDAVDGVVTSGDEGASKRSGALFAKLLDDGRLSRSRPWVHLGDDIRSDGTMAARAGAIAVVCKPREVRLFQARARRLERKAVRCPSAFWELVDHVAMAERLAGRSGAFRSLGRDRLGPAVSSFVACLRRAASDEGVDRLWFMAREGFLLKWAYETFADGAGAAAEARYLFVSRASLFAASSPAYGPAQLSAAMLNSDRRTTWTLLKATGVARERIADVAARHGIGDIDCEIDALSDPGFLALLADPELRACVEERHEDALLRFGAYARGAGLTDGRNQAVVDVGWSGQIQGYLRRSLELLCGSPVPLRGYYACTRETAPLRSAAGDPVAGLLSAGSPSDWIGRSIYLSVQVLEDSCRAPHGSVEGYAPSGEPVLRPDSVPSRAAEAAGDPSIAAMQGGMLRHAAVAGLLSRVAPVGWVDTGRNRGRFALARLMRFPTHREASLLSSIPHALNFSDDPVVRLQTASRAPSLSPVATLRRVRSARWKEAAIGSVMGRAGQMALLALRMRSEAKWPSVRSASVGFPVADRVDPSPSAGPEGHRWRFGDLEAREMSLRIAADVDTPLGNPASPRCMRAATSVAAAFGMQAEAGDLREGEGWRDRAHDALGAAKVSPRARACAPLYWRLRGWAGL